MQSAASGTDDDLVKQLKQMGAPDQVIDDMKASAPVCGVEADNWEYLLLFLRCQTQWNRDFGTLYGLNYPGVEVVMNAAMVPLEDRDATLAAIADFELGALEEIAKID